MAMREQGSPLPTSPNRLERSTDETRRVFPHNEIGTDPGAIKAYAQGAVELGADHMLI